MTDNTMLNLLSKNPDKLLYCIIGNQGSGKTILASQLKEKIKGDVQIFDDMMYTFQRNHMNNVLDRIARARHTQEKTIINLVHVPKEQFNFRENHYVTWVLTSMTPEVYYHLKKRLHLRSKKILKFAKSWKRSAKGLTKTRPYLIMTVSNHKVNYEIHRYKNIPVNHLTERSGSQ